MDVACAGILVADLVAKPVDQWPEWGRLELVSNMELHVGGCAANTGGTLARLGYDVGLFGKVGEDGLGDFILRKMNREGLDIRGVRRDQTTNTSASMVMVDSSGERSFLHYLGANATYCAEDVNWDALSEARILHVAGSLVLPALDGQPTAELLGKGKELGLITSLDTVWDASGRWMSLIEPCLPNLDYFLPSLAEAQALVGLDDPQAIAEKLHEYGVKTVALKMGEEGSFVSSGNDVRLTVPAFQVDSVDGTGAGDAFVGGFLAGVLMGMGLEETARLANAAGAMCVTHIGATAGIPTLDELKTFMNG